MTDEYETMIAQVKREKRLCNPVAVDEEPPFDPATHLACYALKPARGQDLVAPAEMTIENRFGEQRKFLAGSGDRTLCVPAEAHVVGTPADEAREIESFRCRRVKSLPKASLDPMPEVALEDEIETKRMRVRRLQSVCAPASRDGEAIGDPETLLACYQLSPAKGQGGFRPPGAVEMTSELGAQTVNVRGQRTLCVPTTRLR